jgi:peptide/nickel transport system ATP-binding protein
MTPAMAPGNLLEVRNLGISFALRRAGVLQAVEDVSFRVRPGSTVALVGESGSGKSVTAQAVMRLLPRSASITSGSILFRDGGSDSAPIDLARLDPSSRQMRAIRGNRISMIFQEPMTSLSPLHTVGNQIEEAVRLHRAVSGRAATALVAEMLRMVGFPDPQRALRTYPFELSGGLRQRAMIAMALVCRPALLIADEPTTALDVTIQAQILKLIKDLQAELGMAMLMITHDLGVVANVADEVAVMYRGRIVESGTLEAIFEDPRHPYLKALMHAVPRFGMAPGERLTPLREVKTTTGHLLKPDPEAPAAARAGQPLLEVSGLSKAFTIRKAGIAGGGAHMRIQAVDDVSFTLHGHECLGLVGESGCGKTTLSKMIMRAVTPDAGRVTFHDNGRPIDVLALQRDELIAFRRRIQFVFQDPFSSLNPRMTVYDIITEPLVIHRIGDSAYRKEMARELMELVGLDPRWLGRYPHSFSGGQRQRIGIARALALKPDILICDEPVSALDVSIQAQILNLLKDLQAQLGLTYIFVSHNLAVVDYIADRIAVMCAGRLVELAPARRLFRHPVHPYTRALLAAVPEPDPSRRLDLGALMDGRASNPQDWPEPFRLTDGDTAALIAVEDGHYVRARLDARLAA